MLSFTRWARAGLTYLLLLMTADTVATETPAWAATSLIVAGRPADSPISFICFASSIGSDGSCPYGASSSDALTKHAVLSSRCSLKTAQRYHWHAACEHRAYVQEPFANRFANRFAACRVS